MRGLILTLGVFLCLNGSARADWLEFNAGCAGSSEPVINYGQTTSDYITFDVELRGLESEPVEHDLETYSRFNGTEGVRMLSDVGYPELPVVTCFVAVPDNVTLNVKSYRSCADFLDGITAYPAPSQELISEHGMTFYTEVFQKDITAYSSTEWYPGISAELSGEFRLRVKE